MMNPNFKQIKCQANNLQHLIIFPIIKTVLMFSTIVLIIFRPCKHWKHILQSGNQDTINIVHKKHGRQSLINTPYISDYHNIIYYTTVHLWDKDYYFSIPSTDGCINLMLCYRIELSQKDLYFTRNVLDMSQELCNSTKSNYTCM